LNYIAIPHNTPRHASMFVFVWNFKERRGWREGTLIIAITVLVLAPMEFVYFFLERDARGCYK
jgi:ABC-type glycerol-3-phosphate transport system permease component